MNERMTDTQGLENQLCFPLYAASKELIRRYTPLLDRLTLTYTQYITLTVLWETDEMSVKELGERLFLDSGTMTPVLKKLEYKGLISRKRAANDERCVIISLTEAGKALHADARQIAAQAEDCLPLKNAECQQLHKLLHSILDALQND